MNLLVVAVLTIAVFLIAAMLAAQLGLRKHRVCRVKISSKRSPETRVAPEIPAAVYDFYKRGVLSKDFGITPEDTYEHVLHKCNQDIEDDARFLMKRLRLQPISLESREQWIEHALSSRASLLSAPHFSADSSKLLQPIQTIRDMVLWLDWVRQHQNPNDVEFQQVSPDGAQ